MPLIVDGSPNTGSYTIVSFCSLRNPEAHHKARYESFFTLEPEEYVALQDEWKAMTGETGKFLDSIA